MKIIINEMRFLNFYLNKINDEKYFDEFEFEKTIENLFRRQLVNSS